jgi:hypothetical protein
MQCRPVTIAATVPPGRCERFRPSADGAASAWRPQPAEMPGTKNFGADAQKNCNDGAASARFGPQWKLKVNETSLQQGARDGKLLRESKGDAGAAMRGKSRWRRGGWRRMATDELASSDGAVVRGLCDGVLELGVPVVPVVVERVDWARALRNLPDP